MNDLLPHEQREQPAPAPDTPIDAGSQALSEALRSSFGIIKFVMFLLVLVFLASGFFTVGPQEKAIILRFGRPVAEGEKSLLGPGLHWSFPYPIDECVKVSITGIQQVKSTVGWYATTPAQDLAGIEPLAGPTLDPAVDGYALTADNNIIHTRATLTYRIAEPIRYVFSFVNASNAVQNVLDNALLYAASRFPVDGVLTRDVLEFKEAVRRRVTQLVEKQDLGIIVEQCTVQSMPPRQLKDAFANVLKAEVNRSKVLNDARSYENQVTNRAGADAASRINVAQSQRVTFVNDVKGQAKRFNELLPKYRENPKLFVEKSLTESFGRVFTNAQDKIFLAEGTDGNPKELRLLLNRELVKPKAKETGP